MPNFTQEHFLECIKSLMLLKAQGDQILFPIHDTKISGINFSVRNLTTVSTEDPLNRPGYAPDWGTDLFEGLVFENLVFTDCQFKWLNFTGAEFKNITFINCNFENCVLDKALFTHVVFDSCRIEHSYFCKASFKKTIFLKNCISLNQFIETFFQEVHFDENVQYDNIYFEAKSNCFIPEQLSCKPIIFISWNNKKPALSASKIAKKIEDLGAIPLKINFEDLDVDFERLKNEIEHIFYKHVNFHSNEEDSIARKILHVAKTIESVEINKIQNRAKSIAQYVSGVLLPGGNDLNPLFYGQKLEPKTKPLDHLGRDLLEFALLDELENSSVPILGICRGLQVVNVFKGGSLIQDVEGHLYKIQSYTPPKDIYLGRISSILSTSTPFLGYSFHHQAVDKVGKGLHVAALSEDGIVKALEGEKNRFLMLIQWHPEFKGDTSTDEAIILDQKLSSGNEEIYIQFIDSCTAYSKAHA